MRNTEFIKAFFLSYAGVETKGHPMDEEENEEEFDLYEFEQIQEELFLREAEADY